MGQKKNRIRFSVTGIILLMNILFIQCNDFEVYTATVKFIYINDTDHIIDIGKFPLGKYGRHIFESSPKVLEPITHENHFLPRTIDNALFYVSNTLVYDGVKCDTLVYYHDGGEGILGVKNYQYKKLEEWHYEFTYTFTEEDYLKATDCN